MNNQYPQYRQDINVFVAGGGDPEIPRATLGVRTEYLGAAFDVMESKHGSIGTYFSEGSCIDTNQQKALRDLNLGQ